MNVNSETGNSFEEDDESILYGDVGLASQFAFADVEDFRKLIKANEQEFRSLGRLNYTRSGPTKGYWLNPQQANLAHSLVTGTPAEARLKLLTFLTGRPLTTVELEDEERFESENAILQKFENHPRALIEILARCVVRLDRLEADARQFG